MSSVLDSVTTEGSIVLHRFFQQAPKASCLSFGKNKKRMVMSSTWKKKQNRTLLSVNFQMFKLVSEKAAEPEIKLPTSAGSSKKQESSRNIYFCFIDYAKAFDCVDHNKLWKILKEMGIPDHLICLLIKCIQVRKQQLELDMEQQTGSK